MNPSRVFNVLNSHQVSYLLIGGLNFAMNFRPEYLTFDIDLFVQDSPSNLASLNKALITLESSWGPDDISWHALPDDDGKWLTKQSCFCLVTASGPVDVFRAVQGLENRYIECYDAGNDRQTLDGITYRSLSAPHMLECQLALDEKDRKLDRVRFLREIMEK